MDYKEFKNMREKEFNDFTNKNIIYVFGFNKEDFFKDFNESIKKFNNESLTFDNFVSIGNGGYLLESKKEEFLTLIEKYDKLEKEFIENDDKFVYDLFYYTMANHEYIITYDDVDIFYYAGFINTFDDVESAVEELNKLEDKNRIFKIYMEAQKDYLKDYENCN